MSDTHLTDTAFTSFPLPGELMQGIEDAGFSKCTPIQAETLPVALEGRDVAGQAQTGTGKTAAFLLAVYNHLLRHPADERRKQDQPRALILAPTRELPMQIHADAAVLGVVARAAKSVAHIYRTFHLRIRGTSPKRVLRLCCSFSRGLAD